MDDYTIFVTWFESGWHTHELPFFGTYENAGIACSGIAKGMDRKFGNTAQWYVRLRSVPKHEGATAGDFYELFHGRTE